MNFNFVISYLPIPTAWSNIHFEIVQFVHNDEEKLLQTIPTPVQEITHVDDERVNITLSGNTLTANIKNLNIRIVASWHVYHVYRYINYQVFVPRYLCEVSFGHLGNCDGNPDNDESGPNDSECY